MSYAAPRFAPVITPPPSAIVERTAQGGLLMAATEETFSVITPRISPPRATSSSHSRPSRRCHGRQTPNPLNDFQRSTWLTSRTAPRAALVVIAA